ncbi:MAG: phosphotransferase [Chloroflexi bacterium]|nr:phosphotransferase [Chloroflexota bacterium]
MDTISLQDIQTLARQESAKLHHYFIGVEHLFIALTQLSGGLTVAAMEHLGLSPRFVRYSIRETIGRYEDRHYWPGFPETPRAVEVLALARRYAGLHNPSERELLLAILDEGDSVVSRVLHEVGADVELLRLTAANWTSPLRPQLREIPLYGDVVLTEGQARVLQLMFRDYAQVQIVGELTGGHSGALVLLARPVRVDGHKDAPVVVKLDHRYAILYERRRYDLYVKSTLPTTTARLVDSPVVPDNMTLGGLKYTFVGRLDDTEPMSLREFALKHDPQELGDMIRALFESFGAGWWLQRKPYRFGVWREYEHVLPPALVLEALHTKSLSTSSRILRPLEGWSRSNQVMPGEVVAASGFTVQKTNTADDVLHLAAGAQAEAINRSGKIEIRGMRVGEQGFYRGEQIDQVVGRVIMTRDDLLLRQVQALEPDFDVLASEIPSGHETIGDLPNPLNEITRLLDWQVNGTLSTIHGDLHLGNILVGPRGDAWLIDFAWTREGHTLFDWAMLEASLLVEVVAHLAPSGWEGAWGTLARINAINQGDIDVLRERHHVARALSTLMVIRDAVETCLFVPGRWGEYFVALALIALRLVGWKSESIDARRLAFLVSALSIAEAQSPTYLSSDAPWTDTTTDLDQTEIRLDD